MEPNNFSAVEEALNDAVKDPGSTASYQAVTLVAIAQQLAGVHDSLIRLEGLIRDLVLVVIEEGRKRV